MNLGKKDETPCLSPREGEQAVSGNKLVGIIIKIYFVREKMSGK